MAKELPNKSEIVLYQTADGQTRVECRFDAESLWLTQKLMSELFQVGVNTVNYHLKEIYEDAELTPEATIRKYRIVQNEGSRQIGRAVDHYNLADAGKPNMGLTASARLNAIPLNCSPGWPIRFHSKM